MSKSAPRSRLYTPRISRLSAPRLDSDAVGNFTESIARFFGTGSYLLIQTIVVLIWIALNIVAVGLRWDPYPFILLNLAFSTQAAYAAPLILLAQNREADRDREVVERDREMNARSLADTEFLAREMAAIRIALEHKADRDDISDAVGRLVDAVERSGAVAAGPGDDEPDQVDD